MRSRSIAILPNAGLGNKLFPWAHAQVFGVINGINACAIGWTRPHIGPLLRGESQLRFYRRYLTQSGADLLASALLSAKGNIVRNAPLKQVDSTLLLNHLFVWNQAPHWSDYFYELREFRNLIKALIWKTIIPSVRLEVARIVPPVVAVHIRCGDFRQLQVGEDFNKVGGTRTPLEYFVAIIQEVRHCHGSTLPVMVFTDGHFSEIAAVLRLPAVQAAPRNSPITDLLLMSKAQLIITSASSTFGYWAGFLADSPLLLHPGHIHAPIRPESVNNSFFEGAALGSSSEWPDLLVRNIKKCGRELSL
jgi:hypothetical protein